MWTYRSYGAEKIKGVVSYKHPVPNGTPRTASGRARSVGEESYMRLEARVFYAMLTLAFALSLGCAPLRAQQKSRAKTQGKKAGGAAQSKPAAGPETELARLRAQLVEATKEYKSSLGQLLALYEADVKRGDERLARTRELYAQGLVAKREVERDEAAAAAARAKVAAARGQLKSADEQIAETLVEAEAEEVAAKSAPKSGPRAGGGLVQTTAYIRYNGARAWACPSARSGSRPCTTAGATTTTTRWTSASAPRAPRGAR